jgi:hypothetical protein
MGWCVFLCLVLSSSALSPGLSIGDWLSSTNRALSRYEEGMVEEGYSTVGNLLSGLTEESLDKTLDRLQVKKPHKRLILGRFRKDLASMDDAGKKTRHIPVPTNIGS